MKLHELIAQHVQNRISLLQSILEERGLNAAIIYKPENVFYFSNFNPVLNSTPVFLVIPCKGEPSLLVHCIRYAHAREEGVISKVICYGKWGSAPSLCMDPIEAIERLLGHTPHLGLEMDSIEEAKYQKICSILHVEGVDSLSDIISHMKIIKDDYEISRIRRAAHLVDEGVKITIQSLSHGMNEADACTEGQYAMRKMWQKEYSDSEISGFGTSEGGMTDSLQIWCLSNEHIAYGCDCSHAYVPKPGDISLPMAWAKVDGYHAENERTVACGELKGIRKRAFEAVLEARRQVFDKVRPGVTFSSLYELAAQIFGEYGFQNILPGRIGHGVGNSAHEFPSIMKGNDMLLKPGMAMTIEPGLMDSSWGGARHSDTIIITSSGYERLTQLPNHFLVL